MKKYILCFCLLWIGFNAYAQPDESYTISGKVLVEDAGVLFIYLVDEQQFKTPLTGIQTRIDTITQKHLAQGFVAFSFQNIPEGIYGIRVFIDTNNNQKLDRGLFGPTEPWGMSFPGKRKSGIPKFKNISFQVNNDIDEIVIETQGKKEEK